jgi:hypothetical protein
MQNRDICGEVPSQVSGTVDGVSSTQMNSTCQWEADGELRDAAVSDYTLITLVVWCST